MQWSALAAALDQVERAGDAWQQTAATDTNGVHEQVLRQATEKALADLKAHTNQTQPTPPQQSGVVSAPRQELAPALPSATTQWRAYATQASAPGPGDLAATLDVQITPEVTALATSLDNSPLNIAAYVRNNIAFDPYYGSLKGSTATLWTHSGNDYDTASLLLALLRAAGTPSRYVTGAINIPVATAQNWLGVTSANAAYNALSGIPRDKILSGNQLVAIRLVHTWVEAYIPYDGDGTERAWLPIDPSFKLSRYQPLTNLPSNLQFDRNAFFASIKTTLPEEIYTDQVRDYLRTNRPGTTLADLAYRGELVPEALGQLPSSLPYSVDWVIDEQSTAPDSMRHKVILTVDDTFLGTPTTQLLTITLPLAQIATSRLTISYLNATTAMRPLIKVDGTAVATGATTPFGSYNQISIGLIYPSMASTARLRMCARSAAITRWRLASASMANG